MNIDIDIISKKLARDLMKVGDSQGRQAKRMAYMCSSGYKEIENGGMDELALSVFFKRKLLEYNNEPSNLPTDGA